MSSTRLPPLPPDELSWPQLAVTTADEEQEARDDEQREPSGVHAHRVHGGHQPRTEVRDEEARQQERRRNAHRDPEHHADAVRLLPLGVGAHRVGPHRFGPTWIVPLDHLVSLRPFPPPPAP